MTKIEIICGTYGYRPEGSKHPIPIDRGGICEVSEEEAQRLFALCVARPAAERPIWDRGIRNFSICRAIRAPP